MNKSTSGQALAVLTILEQQSLSLEEYQTLLTGHLAALAQAAKRGKLPDLQSFRRAVGFGILTPLSNLRFPGSTEFRFDDHFTVNVNAEVPIQYVGEKCKEWFGGTEVAPMSACELEVQELTERSLDGPIISEIGDELCDTHPALLYFMMKTGQLSKGHCCLLYMPDKNGVRRAVHVDWHGGGWYVRADLVTYPYEWDAGHHVVSRKRLVASV